MKRKLIASVVALAVAGGVVAGCSTDADVASYNLSKKADNFEIQRRIVFVNGITDKYLLKIEGRCSLGNDDPHDEQSVTCKTPDGYKKHFVHLSDNVTVVTEQLDSANVSKDHYVVQFKPSEIIPDVNFRAPSEGVDE